MFFETLLLVTLLRWNGAKQALGFIVPDAATRLHQLYSIPVKRGIYNALLHDSSASGPERAPSIAVEDAVPNTFDPLYNKHPNFCLGDYTIFDISIDDAIMRIPEDFRLKLLSNFFLLAKCNIHLDKFGKFSIAKRELAPDRCDSAEGLTGHNASPGTAPLGNPLSHKSLIKIKGMFKKTFNSDPNAFIRHLNKQKLGTFEVEDLISDVYIPNNEERDLIRFVETEVLGRVPPAAIEGINPVDWDYQSTTNTLRIRLFIRDLNSNLRLKFTLHPGQRPFVIDFVNLVLSEVDVNSNWHYNINSFGGMQVAKAKVRPGPEAIPPTMLKPCPERHRERIVWISGTSRKRLNHVFKLLELLTKNLPPMRKNVGHTTVPINHELDYLSPVSFKTLAVQVNSEFKFFIPLLTYVDLATGQAYLCNNNFPIEAGPRRVWPIGDTRYSKYNARFFPPEYANAGLFSSLDFNFSDEQILDLLSSYSSIRRLVNGASARAQSSQKTGPSDGKLTFEKAADPPRGAPSEPRRGGEADVYYVNGHTKMIFKSGSNAILVNLLL